MSLNINSTGQQAANELANDFFKYNIDKSGLILDNNITDYAAQAYADMVYSVDSNTSSTEPIVQSSVDIMPLIDYTIDNADNPISNISPDSWKNSAKQQMSSDLNDFQNFLKNNLQNYLDWLNGDPLNQQVPTLDDFLSFDPNNLNNYNPNDGYPLNPPTDPTNQDDGIPPNHATPPTPPRRDPLVLDTDKDGFISTVKLQDSQTYFDITGDGIKEKVSWIGSNDGILAYDKNGNGKIDGIDEVFGNFTTSGFGELLGRSA
jgi:hypothetical protein